MTFSGVMANLPVGDLDRGRAFYATLMGRGPDTEPMEGLLEWRLEDDPRVPVGVQVFLEPARAGQGAVVLHCPSTGDLEAVRARLAEAGVEHDEPFDATYTQVLPLSDPDGNRVVLTAPFV
jgi:catechol 2,3-dioxygenase-like lactoylglutathione lyase family enzyme